MNARRRKEEKIDRRLEDMAKKLKYKVPTMSPSLNQLLILKLLLEEWKFSEEHDELNGTDVATYLIDSLDHLMFLKIYHDIDTPEAYILDQLDWNTKFLEGAHEDDIDSYTRWQTFWEAAAWEYGLREHSNER